VNERIITDDDRYPTLTAAGASMLEFLREHPAAPIYRNQSGNRLTAADVDALRQFDREMSAASVRVAAGAPSRHGWRVSLGARLQGCSVLSRTRLAAGTI